MKENIPGVQYIKSKNRGSKYCLSRRFSKSGKDISSSSSKKLSDEEKFIQILEIYKKNIIDTKQEQKIMNLNIDKLKQYI
ncbi:MAG: hypothetical protein CMF62_00285 [Magnetococcales bacterium]|nr:hypothetical protein [Magnetococcales bacterium]